MTLHLGFEPSVCSLDTSRI